MLRNPIDERILANQGSLNLFIPGYDGGDDKSHVLLSLRALDDGDIDYTIAHTAYGILAANRWDGIFSRDRYRTQKVKRP